MLPANTVNNRDDSSHKLLVLFGSPHLNGYTAELLGAVLAATPENFSITCYKAYEISAKPCTDCGFCKNTKACVFHDLDRFYSDFEECEALIIASPVYNGGFPAALKAILDRMQVYYNARFSRGERPPVKQSKKAALLLTCGSENRRDTDYIESKIKQMFTVLNTSLCGSFCVYNTDKGFHFNLQSEKMDVLTAELFSTNREKQNESGF